MALQRAQFEQLRMLMTPREIDESTFPGDAAHYGPGMSEDDLREMRAQKRGDAVLTDAGPYGNGRENLAQSVRRQGVVRPIDIGHGRHYAIPWDVKRPILLNGNTRLAVARDVAPDRLVPVIHHQNPARPEDEGPYPDWAEKVPQAFGWKDRF